jgi:hypothetical protein
MQTPIGASRATSTGLFVHEEWVFFDLRHWYNAVYADTRYVQRSGNKVSKRYSTSATGGRPCFFSRLAVPVQGEYGVVFAK